MYKPLHNISSNIGLSAETIIENWRNFRYRPWHIDWAPSSSDVVQDDEYLHAKPTNVDEDIDEWKVLSRLVRPNNIDGSHLNTLGRRNFDLCFNWEETVISNDVAEGAIAFIRTIQSTGVVVIDYDSAFAFPFSLSEKQRFSFEIMLHHSCEIDVHEPLEMIIQGTTSTGKSYLILCISHALVASTTSRKCPLLFLAPTGIVAFNINEKTIHSVLKLPIKDMQPLNSHSLSIFQKKMRPIRYVLIDEMLFIGPRLFIQIDSQLREAFLENKSTPFGGRFIILVGDLGQLTRVRDKPMHAGKTTGKVF